MNCSETDMLKAVRANPADLGARMVYADAVQERGTEEAEEYAQFIRACVRRERPERLPARVKTGIARCFPGGAVPVHWELMWQAGLASTCVGASTLFWANGLIAGYYGPALLGWEYLHEWLSREHCVTAGHVTDPVGRWFNATRRWDRRIDPTRGMPVDLRSSVMFFRDPTIREVRLRWADRYVTYTEPADAPQRRITEIRRLFFRTAWPAVNWSFGDDDEAVAERTGQGLAAGGRDPVVSPAARAFRDRVREAQADARSG